MTVKGRYSNSDAILFAYLTFLLLLLLFLLAGHCFQSYLQQNALYLW